MGLIATVDDVVIPWLQKWSIPVLRVSLAVVFVWFGTLKIIGDSPVVELVASTVYWVDPAWFVPLLGVIEVLVGLGLLFRIGLRLVLLALVGQLIGTFVVFVVLPDTAFQRGNPLLLTVEGEFIVKNLVLIAAAMVVGTRVDATREQIPTPADS